jgi:pimeloyl-ACP methyl ester carboxylesterase
VSSDAHTGSSRRNFLGTGLAAGVAVVASACTVGRPAEVSMNDPTAPRPEITEGRLTFRPGPPGRTTSGRVGLITLDRGTAPEPAYAYVPDTADGQTPMRLVVFLHGAGGNGHRSVNILRSFADDERLLLLSPKSVGPTWDVILGGFGPDVTNLDRLLTAVTATYPIRGCTLAGFSDGASYALSLGVANGDVFDSVMAFSPGFSAAEVRNGQPRFFISHGVHDET